MPLLATATRVIRMIAMAALVLMMLVTVVDISMRITMNRLVLGSVEIVELMIVSVVFLALPETFLRGQHITVDAIDQFLSAKMRRVFEFAGALLTLLLLAAMAVRMVPIALDTITIGDLTTDLQVSLFWYWLPMLVGSILAVLAMLFVSVRSLKAIRGALPGEAHDQ